MSTVFVAIAVPVYTTLYVSVIKCKWGVAFGGEGEAAEQNWSYKKKKKIKKSSNLQL